MSNEVLPLSIVAKRLEHCSGYEFQSILRTLKSQKYVNHQLLKSDLDILVTKILKLLRSSEDYQVWKGCYLTSVICSFNPVVLSSHAGVILNSLYSKLEQKSDYYSSTVSTPQGKVTLINLVKATGTLIDLIRGKPALTREALTPKLSAIIPLLVTLSQFEPQLCLPILKKLLFRSTTTFKPFVNKFRAVLINLLLKDYNHFNKSTKKLVSDCFAYLHLIKQNANMKDENQSHHKSFPDDQWRTGLLTILFQYKPVIMLCNELLDFSADADMCKLLESLPKPPSDGKSFEEIFPSLGIDMNAPMTLWDIVERFNILIDLTISYISLPTPYAIRVPLGGIVGVCEALLGLSTSYLPLQRGLRRDAELTSMIADVFPQIQLQAVRLLDQLTEMYGNCILTHLPSLLASLELFIPLKHGTVMIDTEKIESMKDSFPEVFILVSKWLSYMGHSLDETTLFTKLVDSSICLSRDVNPLNSMFAEIDSNSRQQAQSKKQKKASRSNAGSMSDLYSHPKGFLCRCTLKKYDAINNFLVSVIAHLKLPSTQQVKIIKYCVTNSIKLNGELGHIPQSFVHLLRVLVLYPGNDRVSILPIAVTLLKNSGDDVFNAICNPRLPFGAVQSTLEIKYSEAEEQSADEEEEASITEEHESTQTVITRDNTNVENINDASPVTDISSNPVEMLSHIDETITVDSTKIFKKRANDFGEVDEAPDLKQPKLVGETTVELVTETISFENSKDSNSGPEVREENDDSDFEIPEIELSEDDDE